MEVICSSSVYFLISELCEKIIRENSSKKCIEKANVRKIRIKCFEILLKKIKYDTAIRTYLDPLNELDIIHFGARIKSKYDYKNLEYADNFENVLNYIPKYRYFSNGYGTLIIAFLLVVRDSVLKFNQTENEMHKKFLIPGPFTIHLKYQTNLNFHLHKIQPSSSKLEKFKRIFSLLEFKNPYLPKHLFEKNCDGLLLNNNKNLNICRDLDFKAISNGFLNFFSLSNLMTNLHSGAKLSSILNVDSSENLGSKTKSCKKKSKTQEIEDQNRFGWNWQSLGTTKISKEKRFGSELNKCKPFGLIIKNNLDPSFEAKIISVNLFISDIKFLLVGIQSESFLLDNNFNFYMVANLSISTIIPSIAKEFLHEFLECGTCYKRIQLLILKKDSKLMLDGFIFTALRYAITDYLIMFRQFIFSHEDSKLLELHERVKQQINQISNLAYILNVYCKVNTEIKPLSGSQFIGFVYKEIMRATQSDMLSLLVFILNRCCKVYFEYIKKWIFFGQLDDPSNELFIGHVDYYLPNTKHHFDKAYFIRKEFVPGFFHGYEESILQCGKYTMLLKEFNPDVSTTKRELKQVDEKCSKYLRKALNLCDFPITVSELYDSKIENKKKVLDSLESKSKRKAKKFQAWKDKILKNKTEKNKTLYQVITAQIDEKQVLNINEKIRDIIFEKELDQKQNLLVNNILTFEKKEMYKTIDCYSQNISFEYKEKKVNIKKKLNKCERLIDYEFETCDVDPYDIEYTNCTLNNSTNKMEISKESENLQTIKLNEENASSNKIDEVHEHLISMKLSEAEEKKRKILASDNVTHKNYKLINESDYARREINIVKNNKKLSKQSSIIRMPLTESIVKADLMTGWKKNKIKVLKDEYNIVISDPSPFCDTQIDSSSNFEDLNEKKITSNSEKIENNSFFTDKKLKSSSQGNNYNNSTQITDIYLNKKELKSQINEMRNESPPSDIYDRCLELMQSNYKLEPNQGLIEYRDFISLVFPKTVDYENVESIFKKQKDLNSLSMISLTEFLQKSVTIPLRAHLKIMTNEVMRVFLKNLDIIGHFNSLRNYFLLMNGEFSSIICDELIGKLEKGISPYELFHYQTLHSVLDKAITSISSGSAKNGCRLSFIVTDLPDKFDILSPSVFTSLCLSYRVTWPTNLILNPETLDKYGDIFKYLFKVKRICWVLEESFRTLKGALKTFGKEILVSPEYRRIQLIRYKFSHFIYSLMTHITASALQASWKKFQDDLIKVKCVEDIYRKHTNYIKKMLFLCMLNKRSLEFYKTIENIFKVVLRFCRNLKSKMWKKHSAESYYVHSRYSKLVIDEEEFEKLVKYVIYLGNKIVKRGYQEEVGELINLINYNNYYVE